MAGGRIDAIYHCPHGPRDECECRKPKAGMLLQAAKDLDINLAASWLIGDRASDAEAARSVGARPILVNNEIEHHTRSNPLSVVDNLFEAAQLIESEIK